MRALKFYKDKGLVLEEIPTPELKDGEALIKVKACSICGSDLRTIKGLKQVKKDGVILGHEVCGEVIDSRHPDVMIGSNVAVYPSLFCGKCSPCKKGYYNLCDNKLSLGNALDGGFAEYMVVPKGIIDVGGLVKVEALSHIACLTEPLACVIHSIETLLSLGNAENALILGAGPLG